MQFVREAESQQQVIDEKSRHEHRYQDSFVKIQLDTVIESIDRAPGQARRRDHVYHSNPGRRGEPWKS
jgi:hypothetical protein